MTGRDTSSGLTLGENLDDLVNKALIELLDLKVPRPPPLDLEVPQMAMGKKPALDRATSSLFTIKDKLISLGFDKPIQRE